MFIKSNSLFHAEFTIIFQGDIVGHIEIAQFHRLLQQTSALFYGPRPFPAKQRWCLEEESPGIMLQWTVLGFEPHNAGNRRLYVCEYIYTFMRTNTKCTCDMCCDEEKKLNPYKVHVSQGEHWYWQLVYKSNIVPDLLVIQNLFHVFYWTGSLERDVVSKETIMKWHVKVQTHGNLAAFQVSVTFWWLTRFLFLNGHDSLFQ